MIYKLEIINNNLYLQTTDYSYNYIQEREFQKHTSIQVRIEFIDRVILGKYAMYIKLKIPVSGFYDLVIHYSQNMWQIDDCTKWFKVNDIEIEKVVD